MAPQTRAEWLAACKNIRAGYLPGGQKANTFLTSVEQVQALHRWGVLDHGRRIVDLGCGNGRLAMGLASGNWRIKYIGVDILRPCIDFCQRTFVDLKDFRFQHLEVANGHYWAKGKPADEAVIDVQDGWADLVVAFSLFTHLSTEAAARRYMDEARRILRPGGWLVATWLVDPPYICSDSPARTVYPMEFVTQLYATGWKREREDTARGEDQNSHLVIVARKDG